jgi:prefoldin subunit 5
MAKKVRKTGSLMEKVDTKYPGYSDEVLGLGVEQLEKRIVEMQKGLEDASQFLEEKSGEAIKSLKEELKELKAPYTEVKAAVALKTKYVVSLIREKGGQ